MSEPVTGEALKLLGRLARKGAYAELKDPGCDGPIRYAIHSPHVCAKGAIAMVAKELVRQAFGVGWLATGTVEGRLQISTSGIRALKTARSAGDGSCSGAYTFKRGRREKLATAAGATVGTGPERTARGDKPSVDEAESPLGWLRRRKGKDGLALIDAAQFDAGERLRADFWYAQMTPRVTANWSAPSPMRRSRRGATDAGVDLRDAVIAARERVTKALKAVGPELSGVLIDVCCHLKGIEMAETESGWPRRSGKVVLILALNALARHYGLKTDGTGEAGAPGSDRALLHWGADDYRPSIDGEERGGK